MPAKHLRLSWTLGLLLAIAVGFLTTLRAEVGVSSSAPEPRGRQAQPADPKIPDSSTQDDTDIDDQVIHDVFQPLQRGMQELNVDKVSGIFDKEALPDYPRVREQIRSFFRRYETINMRYQLLQVTSEKDQASAIAEVDMDAAPADETQAIQRESVRMRFEMRRGPNGWCVTSFRPSDFFDR